MGPLTELAKIINGTAHKKGWYSDDNGDPIQRNFGEVIALEHSELSESLEAWREHKPDLYYTQDADGITKPEGWAVEKIDCVIRILDDLYEHGLNPDLLIKAKMAYNADRSYRHGGKRA